MSVLRDNRDSVMAMLEAFVYDPLISWRLLANNAGGDTAVPIASGVSGNLRSQASNEDDSAISRNSVEQLRVQMAAGSLLGAAAVASSMINRNQSMRNQSVRDIKQAAAALVSGATGALGEDGEPLQENLNARYCKLICLNSHLQFCKILIISL